MIFESTQIPDVVLITPQRFIDDRGYFTQTWGEDEFEAHGLNPRVVARNVSYNVEARTLRGMHFQQAPHAEAKLVCCTLGAIYDVAIDLRPESPTFTRWVGAELRADSGTMLYVPEGFAHGYLSLEPGAIVEYLITAAYAPQAAGGVRWDDPAFGVEWPARPLVINERDRTWPDFVATATPVVS
jgi:dTDP-4-dehydrorhamnose 3,5-epimerase